MILYLLLAQVGLLNVDGYYNSLLALFDNGVEEGFIKPSARHIVLSAPNAKELLVKMEVAKYFSFSFLSKHFGLLIMISLFLLNSFSKL